MRMMTGKNSSKSSSLGVSLDFDGQTAPRICNIARGDSVNELRKSALRYGVKIKFDNDLATKLGQLDVGDEVPYDTYLPLARYFTD